MSATDRHASTAEPHPATGDPPGAIPHGATVLLTGATGFVGRSLWTALEEKRYRVRGLTRSAAAARRRWPDRDWAEGDLDSKTELTPILEGCDAAYYLVHGMATGEPGFRQQEIAQAERFATAAGRAGLRRIVFLGGVAPAGEPSEHLRSRLEVGEALRRGPVPTIELRASMIVGAGSASWIIVRDLAARLPVMVLPRWLRSRTEPLALPDALAALTAALTLPLPSNASTPTSAVFDIPGPDVLTGRQILDETARAMDLRRPTVVEIPLLTPWLSSHWVRLITRAEWEVARELVLGLSGDLLARDSRYWDLIGHQDRIHFPVAARQALAGEGALPQIHGVGALAEWAVRKISAG